jgi:hypothetical protein
MKKSMQNIAMTHTEKILWPQRGTILSAATSMISQFNSLMISFLYTPAEGHVNVLLFGTILCLFYKIRKVELQKKKDPWIIGCCGRSQWNEWHACCVNQSDDKQHNLYVSGIVHATSNISKLVTILKLPELNFRFNLLYEIPQFYFSCDYGGHSTSFQTNKATVFKTSKCNRPRMWSASNKGNPSIRNIICALQKSHFSS